MLLVLAACSSERSVTEFENWTVIKSSSGATSNTVHTLMTDAIESSLGEEVELGIQCWNPTFVFIQLRLSWTDGSEDSPRFDEEGTGSYRIGQSNGEVTYSVQAGGRYSQNYTAYIPLSNHVTGDSLWSDMMANEEETLVIFLRNQKGPSISARFNIIGLTDALAHSSCQLPNEST